MNPELTSFPASFAQRRLWFVQQMSPTSTAYNMVFCTTLPTAPDAVALQWALNALVSRHENLRTAFAVEGGEPVQVVRSRGQLPLCLHNVCASPLDIARIVSESAAQPFDLALAPLARAHLGLLESHKAQLTLVIHHIVADGQTIRILMEDLDVMYRARVAGRIVVLPELPVQYADYAVWQRRSLTGRRLQNLTEYWTRRLEGLPELDLHHDRARATHGASRGNVVPLRIPFDVVSRLRALAAASRTTLFAALLAGFSATVARFSAQSSVAIGIPVSGRSKPELERVAGLFVNSVVFRGDVGDAEETFADCVRRVGTSLVEDLSHQDLPFDRVVDALGVRRRADRNPLFQVMFQLQMRSADRDGDVPAPEEEPLQTLQDVSAQLDISFIQHETRAGEIEGGVVCAADLFDAQTVAQLVDAYLLVLREGSLRNKTRVADLPILEAARRDDVLALGQGEFRAWPGAMLLHELFEQQALRSPHAPAIDCDGSSVSYERLDREANAVAAALRTMQVQPGAIVGVCLPRSAALVTALLGILKAGGAYLVLDPAAPDHRRKFILSDSDAAGVIVPKGREDLGSDRCVLVLHDLECSSGPPPMVAMSPGDPAYAIYTSGSTGQPKGVAISHRAIINHMRWMLETFPLDETDRVLQRTPLTFDASVWEVWAPLLSGSVLHLAPEERLFEPTRLGELIRRCGITTLQAVPSLLRALLDHGGLERCTTLRRVFCGGEALTPELRDAFFAQQHAELCNLYGPSETTIDALYHVCRREARRDPVPIGRPIANVSARVLDEHGQLVPFGVPGELYIGGAAVGIGYIRRPELMAERFVDDPFEPGGKLFRTGDRVRLLRDGEFLFLGRLDDQVKLRGFRIELGEIEAVLRQHPAVSEAAAVLHDHGAGDQRLTAFVATSVPGSGSLVSELLAWLRSRIPAYQVPSTIEIRTTLPKTQHGKIDRRALAEPIAATVEQRSAPAARNDLERAICRCFGEILQIVGVGIDDDFFLLGGHSLLVLRLCDKLSGAVATEVSVVDVFEYPTARQLGDAIVSRIPPPAGRGGTTTVGISMIGR